MTVEILAPAGDEASVDAALTAGAGAIFFGLGELDARRGAQGITASRLPDIVQRIHAGKAKAHLTLNITLGARELGRAARTLAWAQHSGVDAVLICDPALLALKPFFPKLEFHFSTQAAIGSRAGVQAAHRLGIRRVVLARELGLTEIKPCIGLGPEIEVFAQGALCFSVSGHCSMTSWVGGRSGNRGTCTSICRVNWSCNDAEFGRPLDMKDNSAVRIIPDLIAMGVDSLKIEGRLKSPTWVGEAVGLYRRAIAGEATTDELWTEAQALGAYTGREMTDAYFTERRVGLVHPDEGRTASTGPINEDQDPPRLVTLTATTIDRNRITWTATCGAASETFTMTAPAAKAGRSLNAMALLNRVAEALPEGLTLVHTLDIQGRELPRRTVNEIASHVAAWLRRLADDRVDRLKIDIGDDVRQVLTDAQPHLDNIRTLSDRIDRVRIDADQALVFAAEITQTDMVIEIRRVDDIDALHQVLQNRLIISLPTVIYEGDVDALAAVAREAATRQLRLEINGWDGWELGTAAKAQMIAGPGCTIMNPVAARFMQQHGCIESVLSCEMDGSKIIDCCAIADTPLVLQIFGRPALMSTRAWSKAPGWKMSDARETITISPRKEGPIVALRPTEPFDWRGQRMSRIRVAHLEMDLCASPDPLAEWHSRPAQQAHLFNLQRDLH